MLGITLSKEALLLLPLLGAPQEAPPGLVAVEGGRVTIGTPVKEIQQLIKDNKQQGSSLAGETPRAKIAVDDFYLMSTEVTNEQYAEYVRATGAKPPWYWGETAAEAGRVAFAETQGKARAEAVRAGEKPGPRQLFDAPLWWDKNWRDSDWAVPTKLLSHPVTHLSHKEAKGYARWAGLRLMTEFEFQCAARGEDDRRWPWGDEWNGMMANSIEFERDAAMPVGSFPGGAVNGIYDLAGNVWEWTDSPYEKFKGYKALKVKFGQRTEEILAPFDPNHRVIVSGSYSNPQLATRIPARYGAERTQVTAALGFRCASSTMPGFDAARTVLSEDIRLNVLPADVKFYAPGTVITHRWEHADGAANKVEQMNGGAPTAGSIADYQVIKGYEQILFVPVAKVGAGSVKELTSNSEGAPSFLGFLTTSLPIAEPKLDPGTYLVAWRGRGAVKDPEVVDGEVPFYEVPGFDEEENVFVFYDLEANPRAASVSPGMLYDRMRTKGTVAVQKYVAPTEEELAEMEKAGVTPPPPLDTVRFVLAVGGKARSKGFLFDFPLLLDPADTPDDTWFMAR